MLYPEDPYNLNRVKDDPAHVFFKQFGAQVPRADWNHPGTKQGIYMIGPQGEYLGAMFASPPADVVRRRLAEAVTRWERLRREKSYANRSVPALGNDLPPEVAGRPLIFRASLRDLPQNLDRRSIRYEDQDRSREGWGDFVRWAWNQNWIGFDRVEDWVTFTEDWVPVRSQPVRQLAREILVDNVRGQGGPWQEQHLRIAEIQMRRAGQGKVEYRGRFRMDAGRAQFEGELYGESTWNARERRFSNLDLLVIGTRRGSWPFNQRERDPGPSPIGFSINLFEPPARTTPSR